MHRKQQRLAVDEPKHDCEHVGWERVDKGSWGLICRSARHFPLLGHSLRCSTTPVDHPRARCIHRARVRLDSGRVKNGTFGRSRSLQRLALCRVATTTTLCPVHLSALVRAEPNLRLASATNKHTNKQAQGTGKWLVQESIMTVSIGLGLGRVWGGVGTSVCVGVGAVPGSRHSRDQPKISVHAYCLREASLLQLVMGSRRRIRVLTRTQHAPADKGQLAMHATMHGQPYLMHPMQANQASPMFTREPCVSIHTHTHTPACIHRTA
jgi:hypothetical protein